ncbi:hypothetical protein RB195_020548 [Necator americanus]
MISTVICVVVFLFSHVLALQDGEMELVLVQAMWRHGDRSPTKTFKTDPFQEGNWTFGGGGFGQLSPFGMMQHMMLGRLLRKTYVDTGFLNRTYSSREIYVRSTDVNRTIISAISNLMGMYGQRDGGNVPGIDYPFDPNWPIGFVPIAVHTVHKPTDYVGIPDGDCYRRDKLWEMAMSSGEVKEYMTREDVLKTLNFLISKCGQEISLDYLHVVRDPLYVEQIYFNETLRKVNPWFTDDLYKKVNDMHKKMERFKYGNFEKKILINGLDIGLELKKMRGGPMFNELTTRMNFKLDCMGKNKPECKWINGLKYYAYSVHDSTMFAFFSVLDIAQKVLVPGVYPEYSAAAFIELWMNHTDNQPYFKLTFHPDDNSGINSITKEIHGCDGKDYCKLDVFRTIDKKYKPDQPLEQWCEVDPNSKSGSGGAGSRQISTSWTASILAFAVIFFMW